MNKLSIKDIDLSNRKVLIRVDFNTPLKDGEIEDDTKIKASLPTIKYILEKGGSAIIISHLGRPKGKIDPSLSLKPAAKRLSALLGRDVLFSEKTIGDMAKNLSSSLKKGALLLLENLRFNPAEESPEKDPLFSKTLASYAEIYVNDAFGVSHRKHASVYNVPKYFKKRAMGLLLEKEVSVLSKLLKRPKRPFYAIMGGSKISSKLGVIKNLLKKVDMLFIGGAMVYTFLKAKGQKIGSSLLEEEEVDNIKVIMKESMDKIILPLDIVITDESKKSSKIIPSQKDIPPSWQGVDIGPKTVSSWEKELKKCKTVFWNGPLGLFEIDEFAKGTNEIAKTLSSLSATTVVGGGDSILAINRLGISKKFTHISTGGGASLEFIEYETLPAIEVLSDK